MPNRKLTELDELLTPANEDVIAIVDDSDGNLLTKNKFITVGNLLASVTSSITVLDTDVFSDSDVTTIRVPAGQVSAVSPGFVEFDFGEPYFEETYALDLLPPALPNANANPSCLLIGGGTTTAAANQMAIGTFAQVTAGEGGVAVGTACVAGGTNAIAMGDSTGAAGDDALGIGQGCDASGAASVAIGFAAVASNSTAIALGNPATASGSDSIAIGNNASATNTDSLAIGDGADCQGVDSTAIGEGATVIADLALAIGDGATVENAATSGIAIGNNAAVGSTGTASPNSIVVGVDSNTLGIDSTVVGQRNTLASGANTTVCIGNDNSFTASHDVSICIGSSNQMADAAGFVNNNIAIGNSITVQGGVDNILIGNNPRTPPSGAHNGNIILGFGTLHQSSGDNAVILGNNTEVSSNDCVSIGTNNDIDTSSDNAITIGTNATISANANDAIQLGTGTNGTASTFQFLTNRIANAEGLYTSHVAVNYSPADADNVTSHFAALDTELATIAAALAGIPSLPVNEDITSAIDVTVTPGVSNDRLFITPTANINLILETTGATNETFFTFVNVDPSGGDISIRIDLVGNPVVVTLNAALSSINVAYTGTDYRFWA